ncbi:MAG: alpha-L-arabinofuranosidase C-terminal domain-containing protein, partial [Thermoguttaceae bacterium]
TPDLIWCDNLSVYGTPSYYVQQMFSRNRGDVVLPVNIGTGQAEAGKKPGLYATASRDEKSDEVIIKVVNSAAEPVDAAVQIKGAGEIASKADVTVLAGAKLSDENSFAEPKKVVPMSLAIEGVAPEFKYTFKPWSVTVLRIAARHGRW